MKRLFSSSISMLLMLSILMTSATAANIKPSNTDTLKNEYILVGVDDIELEPNNQFDYSIPLEELIENSVNIRATENSYTGTYKSDKLDAGLTGYKYQISFDWVATLNSGDYVFKSISNKKIKTYANYLILALTWSTHDYEITKSTYSYSASKKTVTFYTNYTFIVGEYSNANNKFTIYSTNEKPIKLQSLL